jgi:putative DNA primase/helicase
VFVSPFGLPSRKEGGLILKWNGTSNEIEGQLANNHGLPIALDEASMNRMKDYTEMIYVLAEGSEKARMTKELTMRERRRWSGFVFSTAEHSLHTKSNQNTGLKVRLFEIGNRFWTKSAENSKRLTFGLLKNYGHAGPMFVQYLLTIGKERVLETWRKWAKTCFERMEIKDPFSHRIADKLGLIMATAELVNERFDFTLNLDAILGMLLEIEQQTAGMRDVGANAYNYFKQMVIQHRSKFEGEFFRENGYECLGRITRKGNEIEVSMLTQPFRQWMAEGGFEDVDVILQNWKEKGYLDHDKDKLTRKRAAITVVDKENQQVVTTSKPRRDLFYCVRIKENIFDFREEETTPKTPIQRKIAEVGREDPAQLFDE